MKQQQVNYKHVSIVLGFILLGMLARNVFGPKKVGFKYVTHESDALQFINKTQAVATAMQKYSCNELDSLGEQFISEAVDGLDVLRPNLCTHGDLQTSMPKMPASVPPEVQGALNDLFKLVMSTACKDKKLDKDSLKTLLKDVLAAFCN